MGAVGLAHLVWGVGEAFDPAHLFDMAVFRGGIKARRLEYGLPQWRVAGLLVDSAGSALVQRGAKPTASARGAGP